MASNPLELHPQAEEEYLTSLDWYVERSPLAAANFQKAFERAIEKIQAAPTRWPIYFEGCRKYALHQFPFAIVYRVFPSHVMVLAVAHGHRQPGYWRGRL